MDDVAGHGWRLVLAPGIVLAQDAAMPNLTIVALGDADDGEGVATRWFERHACVGALVRPDNYVYGTAGSVAGVIALCGEAAAALELSACHA